MVRKELVLVFQLLAFYFVCTECMVRIPVRIVCVCVCVCVCVSVCLSVCLSVCVYVCMYCAPTPTTGEEEE